MPSEKGVSGGPLIRENDKNIQVIGLYGTKTKGYATAIKLRKEMFEDIEKNFKSTLHSYNCRKFGII
jgi:hypothetical protein